MSINSKPNSFLANKNKYWYLFLLIPSLFFLLSCNRTKESSPEEDVVATEQNLRFTNNGKGYVYLGDVAKILPVSNCPSPTFDFTGDSDFVRIPDPKNGEIMTLHGNTSVLPGKRFVTTVSVTSKCDPFDDTTADYELNVMSPIGLLLGLPIEIDLTTDYQVYFDDQRGKLVASPYNFANQSAEDCKINGNYYATVRTDKVNHHVFFQRNIAVVVNCSNFNHTTLKLNFPQGTGKMTSTGTTTYSDSRMLCGTAWAEQGQTPNASYLCFLVTGADKDGLVTKYYNDFRSVKQSPFEYEFLTGNVFGVPAGQKKECIKQEIALFYSPNIPPVISIICPVYGVVSLKYY